MIDPKELPQTLSTILDALGVTNEEELRAMLQPLALMAVKSKAEAKIAAHAETTQKLIDERNAQLNSLRAELAASEEQIVNSAK